jgi:hypothetical protein
MIPAPHSAGIHSRDFEFGSSSRLAPFLKLEFPKFDGKILGYGVTVVKCISRSTLCMLP